MDQLLNTSPYFVAMAYFGLAIAIVAFLPLYTRRAKVTYIIPLLCLGFLLYLIGAPLPWPDPIWDLDKAKIITEIIVILSLMTAGLKIGTQYKWNEWRRPLSLIVITMPLFMGAVYLVSYYLLGLNGPVSLLLSAVLAPTDPVLASEMQLEEHQHEDTKETGLQFTLTAEAGINDGFAFPFVFLAILWSKSTSFGDIDWGHFVSFYLLYKIIGGLIIGALIGFLCSSLIKIHNRDEQKFILSGFIAVALTFFSYGLAEFISTYGFLSVFATGVFLQHHRPKKESESVKDFMLPFIEEVEKLTVVIWTIFFGGALLTGILNYTDGVGIIVSLAIVLVLRPIFGYLAMATTPYSNAKKWAIGFFGIKGIGSYFYLTYGILHGNFKEFDELFGIVSYVVLFSIVIHGFTSLRVLNYFNLKRK
ncbi:sodium/proton antiporter, CPA1 family [Flavobacteriaceae bacterium MAR_2010_188]|nr:sodium/proton antiporter, CPA1 family [Flavobacteriaceae bacterium MAR_2010_188]